MNKKMLLKDIADYFVPHSSSIAHPDRSIASRSVYFVQTDWFSYPAWKILLASVEWKTNYPQKFALIFPPLISTLRCEDIRLAGKKHCAVCFLLSFLLFVAPMHIRF